MLTDPATVFSPEATQILTAEGRSEFSTAQPFPHVVIDNFLLPEVARGLLGEFPLTSHMPKSRDYVFGDKHELSSVAGQGPYSLQFYEAVMSPYFASAISSLTGRQLFVDPAFHGGGFHQGASGSFLDMHVDFNVHPLHNDWLRVLNILVYLNADWDDTYDGRLIIQSKASAERKEIAPLFNRAVVMLTSDDTLHGYRRMTLPAGVTRKSLASYAYEAIQPGTVQARTTGWAPQGAGRLKAFLAHNYDSAVKLKTRIAGSGTAKNR